jgi:hypothetical protein
VAEQTVALLGKRQSVCIAVACIIYRLYQANH